MERLVLAEYRKLKHTFIKKAIVIAPLFVLAICILVGTGAYMQNGGYNYWYLNIFPGLLALLCNQIVKKDAGKMGYRSILCLPVKPEFIWISKILLAAGMCFVSIMILFTFITIGGCVYGAVIPPLKSLLGSIVLFLTFLWQIPLCMLISDRFGTIPTVLLNIAASMGSTIFLSKSSLWFIPYAIPARLMCPIIGVLPNALLAEPGDPLLRANVVFPGLAISIMLFVAFTVLTANRFGRKEVR